MPLFTNHMELGNLSSRPACKRSDVDVDQRERVEATLSNLVAASKTHAMSAGMSPSPSLMRRCTQAAATYVSPSSSATNGFAPSLRFCGQGGDDDTTAWVVVGSCEKAERCAQHELEQERGRWGSSVLNLSVRCFNKAHGPGTNFGTLGCTLATLSLPPSCASCHADTAAPIANAVAGSMRVVGPFPLHSGTFYALVSATTAGVRSDVQTLAEFDEAAAALKRILALRTELYAHPSELDLEYLYSVMVVEETIARGRNGALLLCGPADRPLANRIAGLFYTGAASFVVKEHDMMPDGFTITLPS
ncbi:hypothetical protein B0H14DRAFT_2582947 [Mycena olivaceomarginata]|nr:hypothetical protein B0H14DRAFT_2582947 [Mycena olivaceomarginata]